MHDPPRIDRNPSVLQRSLRGEHVLYHPATDEAMALDAIGSIVWDLLASGSTRAQLIEVLGDQFDVPEARIARDLEPLLARLVEARMITLD